MRRQAYASGTAPLDEPAFWASMANNASVVRGNERAANGNGNGNKHREDVSARTGHGPGRGRGHEGHRHERDRGRGHREPDQNDDGRVDDGEPDRNRVASGEDSDHVDGNDTASRGHREPRRNHVTFGEDDDHGNDADADEDGDDVGDDHDDRHRRIINRGKDSNRSKHANEQRRQRLPTNAFKSLNTPSRYKHRVNIFHRHSLLSTYVPP